MFDGDGLFQYTNVYQHISMFMGFAISGLVDLIGLYIPLPEGTEQVCINKYISIGIRCFLYQ